MEMPSNIWHQVWKMRDFWKIVALHIERRTTNGLLTNSYRLIFHNKIMFFFLFLILTKQRMILSKKNNDINA